MALAHLRIEYNRLIESMVNREWAVNNQRAIQESYRIKNFHKFCI